MAYTYQQFMKGIEKIISGYRDKLEKDGWRTRKPEVDALEFAIKERKTLIDYSKLEHKYKISALSDLVYLVFDLFKSIQDSSLKGGSTLKEACRRLLVQHFGITRSTGEKYSGKECTTQFFQSGVAKDIDGQINNKISLRFVTDYITAYRDEMLTDDCKTYADCLENYERVLLERDNAILAATIVIKKGDVICEDSIESDDEGTELGTDATLIVKEEQASGLNIKHC